MGGSKFLNFANTATCSTHVVDGNCPRTYTTKDIIKVTKTYTGTTMSLTAHFSLILCCLATIIVLVHMWARFCTVSAKHLSILPAQTLSPVLSLRPPPTMQIAFLRAYENYESPPQEILRKAGTSHKFVTLVFELL